MSNYPPGVTGNEWQIAGFPAELEDGYSWYLAEFEKDRRREYLRQLAEHEIEACTYDVYCIDCYDEPLDFGDWVDDQDDW